MTNSDTVTMGYTLNLSIHYSYLSLPFSPQEGEPTPALSEPPSRFSTSFVSLLGQEIESHQGPVQDPCSVGMWLQSAHWLGGLPVHGLQPVVAPPLRWNLLLGRLPAAGPVELPNILHPGQSHLQPPPERRCHQTWSGHILLSLQGTISQSPEVPLHSKTLSHPDEYFRSRTFLRAWGRQVSTVQLQHPTEGGGGLVILIHHSVSFRVPDGDILPYDDTPEVVVVKADFGQFGGMTPTFVNVQLRPTLSRPPEKRPQFWCSPEGLWRPGHQMPRWCLATLMPTIPPGSPGQEMIRQQPGERCSMRRSTVCSCEPRHAHLPSIPWSIPLARYHPSNGHLLPDVTLHYPPSLPRSERRFTGTPIPTSSSAGEKVFRCSYILSYARRHHITVSPVDMLRTGLLWPSPQDCATPHLWERPTPNRQSSRSCHPVAGPTQGPAAQGQVE